MWSRFTSSANHHRKSITEAEHHEVALSNAKIVVFGAGLIGTYIGARLASEGGFSIHFICRESFQKKVIEAGGIQISTPSKPSHLVPSSSFHMYTHFDDLVKSGVTPTHVLLTMKRGAFADALKDLAHYSHLKLTIVPCFNGMFADPEISAALPESHPCSCIWPWGIVPLSPTSLLLASDSGQITFPQTPCGQEMAYIFKKSGFPITFAKDMEAQINGRFIMAMNNAINALSGIPIKDELMIRGYRTIISKCLEETLAVFRAADIRFQAPFSIIPASKVPSILNMPDFLFGRTVANFFSVDSRVISSMHHDFLAGKKTEIDFLQGAIVALGERHGIPTPTLSHILSLVKKMEAKHAELGTGLVIPHTPEQILPPDAGFSISDGHLEAEIEV